MSSRKETIKRRVYSFSFFLEKSGLGRYDGSLACCRGETTAHWHHQFSWPLRLAVRLGVAQSFVPRVQAAFAAEGVGWVCRTSYWALPDETRLLAPRLGAKFCPARPIALLAAELLAWNYHFTFVSQRTTTIKVMNVWKKYLKYSNIF